MARKLKTYVTTIGFFDLAVAAPSMKAALEIWGSPANLFHQGFARETDDPAIIKAAMEKPGVLLQRGVGTRGPFKEHAELPDISVFSKASKHKRSSEPSAKPKRKAGKTEKTDPATSRKAAQLYDLQGKRRARENKDRARRERGISKAEATLDAARAKHEEHMGALSKEHEALERRLTVENERWKEEERRLEAALDRARE